MAQMKTDTRSLIAWFDRETEEAEEWRPGVTVADIVELLAARLMLAGYQDRIRDHEMRAQKRRDRADAAAAAWAAKKGIPEEMYRTEGASLSPSELIAKATDPWYGLSPDERDLAFARNQLRNLENLAKSYRITASMKKRADARDRRNEKAADCERRAERYRREIARLEGKETQ